MIKIKVNGEIRSFDDDLTIIRVLETLEFEQRGIAVALNDTVIPRSEFGRKQLSDGDELEIIHAVGGGNS